MNPPGTSRNIRWALMVVTAGGLLAGPRVARAEVERGGQVVLAAGGAVGQTYRSVVNDSIALDQGSDGKAGGELGVRLWAGPVVVGGTAMGILNLFGPSERALLADAGVKAELGRWRLMALLEYGAHRVSDLGGDFLATATSPSSVTVPCWGARLSIDRKRPAPSHLAWGLSFFVLNDQRTRDINVDVSALWGTRSDRFRVGGTMAGAMFRLTLGS
jgi:hypothetical protein